MVAITHCFAILIILCNIMTEQKKGGTKNQKITVIEALHLSTKIQGVISNVVITEKNEKQYVRLQLGIPGTQVHL